MIQPIITNERKLHRVSVEVDTKREFSNGLQQLIVDMKDTLRATNRGIGLSAIQIDVPKRVIVIKYANDQLVTYINPIIDGASKELVMSIEECLSVPGKQYALVRHAAVDVFYQTPLGQIKSVRMQGMLAKVFQHEYDHLSGVIISDVGLEYTDDLKVYSDEELAKIVADYQQGEAEKATNKKKSKKSKKKANGGDVSDEK